MGNYDTSCCICEHCRCTTREPTTNRYWVKRFLKRHPVLKTVNSAGIDLTRWKDTTPEVINDWFDAFIDALKEHDVEQHNVYNMDETGFGIGTSQCNRVIIDTTLRTRYKVEPGHQEWVSAVECICADGSSLPPLIIFKAKQISNSWINPNTPLDWKFSVSTKVWTSNKHGLEWLRQVFEPST